MLLGQLRTRACRWPSPHMALLTCTLLALTISALLSRHVYQAHIMTVQEASDQLQDTNVKKTANLQRRGLGLGMLTNIIPPAIASLIPGPASSLAAKITADLMGALPTAALPTLLPTSGLPIPANGLPLPTQGLPLPGLTLPTAGLPLPSGGLPLPTGGLPLPTAGLSLPTAGVPLLTNIVPSLPVSAPAALPTADAILGLGNKLGDLLGNLIPFAANSIAQAVTSKALGLVSDVQAVATNVAALANQVASDQLPVPDALNAAGDLVGTLNSAVSEIINDVTANITDILPGPVLDSVVSDLKDSLGDVIAIPQGPVDMIGDIIENNVCGLVTAVDGVLQTVAGFCGQMDSAVSEATATVAALPSTDLSAPATATPSVNVGNTPSASTGAPPASSSALSSSAKAATISAGTGLSASIPDFTGIPNLSSDGLTATSAPTTTSQASAGSSEPATSNQLTATTSFLSDDGASTSDTTNTSQPPTPGGTTTPNTPDTPGK